MIQRNHFKPKIARWFSQWTRKSYAIFLSINNVVHIGHVNADISGKLLLKSKCCGLSSLTGSSGKLGANVYALNISDNDPENLFPPLALLEACILSLHKPTCKAAFSIWPLSLSKLKINLVKIISKPVILNNLRHTGFFILKL